MLDERFRSFVHEVAEADTETLSAVARERIFERVAAEGPGLVRRARRVRVAILSAGPVLAVAAALMLFVAPRGHERAVPSTTPVAARTAARACASRPVVSGVGFSENQNGPWLDLGVTAVAQATGGTAVKLLDAEPCRTVVALDSGTVAVHAKDLGGGELVVRAPGGEVTVHGTIFAVTQDGTTFTVEVAEGHVGVTDRAGTQEVSTGQRVSVSDAGVARSILTAERGRAIRAAVGAPEIVGLDSLKPFESGEAPPPPSRNGAASGHVAETASGARSGSVATPEPSAIAVNLAEDVAPAPPEPRVAAAPPSASADPLTMAEQARRAGDFAKARELYRRAGDGAGVTAEAAWVALARMELSLGHAVAARDATNQRQVRFGQGTLAPEALWIDVRTYRETGDTERARDLAGELIRRWPSSPQASAAQRWLSAN